MCVVIDACVASLVFGNPTASDFKPVVKWIIKGEGVMVHGGENTRELLRVEGARIAMVEWARTNKAIAIPGVDREAKKSLFSECRSNDKYIIALARLSGARTLCSSDRDLHADFRNKELVDEPRGHVYQNCSHSRHLRHTKGCKGRKRK